MRFADLAVTRAHRRNWTEDKVIMRTPPQNLFAVRSSGKAAAPTVWLRGPWAAGGLEKSPRARGSKTSSSLGGRSATTATS